MDPIYSMSSQGSLNYTVTIQLEMMEWHGMRDHTELLDIIA